MLTEVEPGSPSDLEKLIASQEQHTRSRTPISKTGTFDEVFVSPFAIKGTNSRRRKILQNSSKYADFLM
jgi:hypothetical protein